MNTDKLKTLFEKSEDKYADAQRIGTTYQSIYNIIYKGSICKVDLLQKIASFYKVPIGYFFDEDIPLSNDESTRELNSARQEIEKLRKEIEHLRTGKRSNVSVQEQPVPQPESITNERLLSIIESQQRTIENLSKR